MADCSYSVYSLGVLPGQRWTVLLEEFRIRDGTQQQVVALHVDTPDQISYGFFMIDKIRGVDHPTCQPWNHD